MLRLTLFLLASVLLFSNTLAQEIPTRQDSLKGSITLERAWWEVVRYDITIEPNIENHTVIGKNNILFEQTGKRAGEAMQIDLQAPLQIDSVLLEGKKIDQLVKVGNAWFINLPNLQPKINAITVYYSGTPKESVKPPYDGGIVWSKDSLNRPWVSVACQLVGGSVWYPCKDHYSEEPDQGASLTVVVPDSLVAVANGRLTSMKSKQGKSSYTWSVENPINNYGVSFYIGNYVELKRTYAGEKGDLDMSFWVLDYNKQKAVDHMIPEVNLTLKAFEKWFGPYPFYEDGFKMVDAPYIGMEHQSAIAYGNQYRKGRYKFKNLTALDKETDRLIVHEMAHEWYGNNITMSDMADRWVQEGFAAYGEELVMEELFGREIGREFYITRRKNYIKNKKPLISPYGIFQDAGPDMYFKGWAIIHMIREIVDDDVKFRSLLR